MSRSTGKLNTVLEVVWVTHWETSWGPHLESVSKEPWADDYDAPITETADQTPYVDKWVADQALKEMSAATVRMAHMLLSALPSGSVARAAHRREIEDILTKAKEYENGL